MDSARSRLQSVQEQLERTKQDLKETLEIKEEANASGDQELIEEVKESETRLRTLISELEAETAKLQKPNASAALRARLKQTRDREAQARNVLGSGELPSGVGAPGQPKSPVVELPPSPLIPNLPPVQKDVGGNASSLSPRENLAASQGPAKNGQKPFSSGQEEKLIGDFSNLSTNQNQPPSVAFGSSSVPFNKKPLDLTTANSTASQISTTTSVINNPPKSASNFSLDSFGENAFGGPPSTKSTIKSSPSSPHQSHPTPMESAFRRSDGSASVKSVAKDDFGFGESAFPSGGFEAPTLKQWGTENPSQPNSARPNLADQGRGVSLRDSFPTNPPPTSEPQSMGSQWQAFDLAPQTGKSQDQQPAKQGFGGIQSASSGNFAPSGGISNQPSYAGSVSSVQPNFLPQPHSAQSQPNFPQGIQGAQSAGSDFGSLGFSAQPQRAQPRSGNPFMDNDEPAETSIYTNPAAYSWGGSGSGTRRSTDSTSDYNYPGTARSGQLRGPPLGAPQIQNPQPAFGQNQQNLGFGSIMEGNPQNSADYDPFGPPPSQPKVSQIQQQPDSGFGQDAFPSSFPTTAQPSIPQQQTGQGMHNGRFGHPGQPYLVTPSAVVIPDADWDAAFSQPAAKQSNSAPVEDDVSEASGWTPMGENDRTKVRSAYEDRYKAQHTNGIGKEDAYDLYQRGSLKEPFEKLFALADLDEDGRLNFSEFLIYMHSLRLLNQKKDAVKLPRKFNNRTASFIIGTDYQSLPKLVNTDIDFSTSSQPGPTSEISSEQKIKDLVSRGSNEEDAKRALFLNGDDLNAASQWLETKKSGPQPDPGNIPGTISAFKNVEPHATPTPVTEAADGARVSLRIDKAILSYKKPVEQPTISVTIVNSWGEAVGESIQTPPGKFDRDSGIITFGHTLTLPQGINKIADDSCVYFELKQYKMKEKKWSTMGWTYRHKIHFVKVVDGQKCVRVEAQGLNLYEKPMDFKSHFKQAAMKKMRPLSSTSPDFYLRVAEAT